MPILLCIAVLVADQLSKLYIQSSMTLGMSVPVVPHVFHITYILNPGAAFGILENKTWFFIAVALILLVGVAYLYPRLPANQPIVKLGAGLLVGGAIGNLIDRVRIGYVIDFFDFRIWPIFNVADICIVCGVACLAYYLLMIPDETEPATPGKEQ